MNILRQFSIFLFLSVFFNGIQGQKLEVMTFNIRLSTASDGENYWVKRKPDVLALLSYYQPEIFGVQEALPEQMEDLKNGLPNYHSIGVGRDDGKNKGEFSAIFYDKNLFDVLQSGTFWLSETPEKPSKGWDAAYNRICSYALFLTKKGKQKFWAFNVHFDHVGQVARVRSSELILEKMKAFNPQNYPVVLTGDFNLTDETEPIKIISKTLEDNFKQSQKPHYGPDGTFQAFDVLKPAEERIDYIFTKGFQIESNRTINDRRENLLYPSDHFPVLSVLYFQKK